MQTLSLKLHILLRQQFYHELLLKSQIGCMSRITFALHIVMTDVHFIYNGEKTSPNQVKKIFQPLEITVTFPLRT